MRGADLENGLWGGNTTINPDNRPFTNASFVTAMLKGRPAPSRVFALKGGDAQQLAGLTTLFQGPRPASYAPMKKQGAVLLGIGGDNSNGGVGTFFEGVMTSGFASDAVDREVSDNIVSAGYGS